MLRTGDVVRVRQVGDTHWTEAKVALASPNGKSIALELDGQRQNVAYQAFASPHATIDYDAETVIGLTGHEYEVDVRGIHAANH